MPYEPRSGRQVNPDELENIIMPRIKQNIEKKLNETEKSYLDMGIGERMFTSKKTPVEEQMGIFGDISSAGRNLKVGIAKGALSTAQGLSTLGQKTFGRGAEYIASKLTGREYKEPELVELPKYMTEAEGAMQTTGKVGEQIGELFIPSSWFAKGAKVIETGIGASKLGQLATGGSRLAKTVTGAEKLGARMGLGATEAGVGTYLQTGGDKEQASFAAKFGAAIPAVGQVAKLSGNILGKLGEKIETSLIKPSKADIADGFDVKNVFKYDLGGSLAKTAEKLGTKMSALSNELDTALKGTTLRLNLHQALDAVAAQLKKGRAKTFGYNSKIDNAIEHFRKEIDMITPNGIVGVPKANEIKRQVGNFGAWQFGMRNPDSDALETVANALYTKLRLGIEEAAPQVGAINKQLSELIPIENALIRRIPVAERANVVGLMDVASAIPGLLGDTSSWGLFLLNRLSRSGNVANILNKFKIKDNRGIIKTIIFGSDEGAKLSPNEKKAAEAIRKYMNSPKAGMSIEDVSQGFKSPAVGQTAKPSPIFYHGTSQEAAKKIAQSGYLKSNGDFGLGVYMTPDKEFASTYGNIAKGKRGTTLENSINGKILKISDIYKEGGEILDSGTSAAKMNLTSTAERYLRKKGYSNKEIQKLIDTETIDGYSNQDFPLPLVEKFYEELRKAGYAAVRFGDDNIDELLVINPKAIKINPSVTPKPSVPPYKETGNLTTKVLQKLEGRSEVSRQFISDLTNTGDLKQQERELIREILSRQKGDKINVPQFAEDVKAELLPLKVHPSGKNKTRQQYEYVALQGPRRGPVANYFENKYESPIETKAGQIHWGSNIEKYFGHTRGEDLVPENLLKKGYTKEGEKYIKRNPETDKVVDFIQANRVTGDTRRIIEIQSDLYQKGRLEGELFDQSRAVDDIWDAYDAMSNASWREDKLDDIISKYALHQGHVSAVDKIIRNNSVSNIGESGMKALKLLKEKISKIEDYDLYKRKKEITKLAQYNNPSAHFRMVREEVRRAAKDGKTKLQFPTGETAMEIEGLGGPSRNPVFRFAQPGSTHAEYAIPDIQTGKRVTPENIKDGDIIHMGTEGSVGHDRWIVTSKASDGRVFVVPEKGIIQVFNRVSKKDPSKMSANEIIDELDMIDPEIVRDRQEMFNLIGKKDIDNPIYKFYEKDLGKYLKSKYNAKLVKDPQDVTWYEIDIKPEMATKPVEAFGKASLGTMIAGGIGAGGIAGAKALLNKHSNGTK